MIRSIANTAILRATTHMTGPLDHNHLIGIIILSKFIKLPLTRYEALVEKVETSPMFTQLWPGIISTNLFPRAQALESAGGLTPNAIGQLRRDEDGFYVSYRHPGLAREFILDEGRLSRSVSLTSPRCSFGEPDLSIGDFVEQTQFEIQALKRQLRLINTRNRLTHMTLMGIAKHQLAYLTSGDALCLRPLSQISLARWVRCEMQGNGRLLSRNRLEFVDNSMISRLTRSLNVISPQGQDIPLQEFFSSTGAMHKRMIKAILDEEEEQIKQGHIARAYTDEKIKERLEVRFGISIARRTVSACRQAIRVASSYTRNRNHTYPPKLAEFSFYFPLNVVSLNANAPEVPGVYEISLAEEQVDYPRCSSGVVYIGSSKNLRKRLRDHLRQNSKNSDLRAILEYDSCFFRYIIRSRDLRKVEKELCQYFLTAYGSLPRCNRIRP